MKYLKFHKAYKFWTKLIGTNVHCRKFLIEITTKIKSSERFTKLGKSLLEYRNFSIFSAPAAPKKCHFSQFLPKSLIFFICLRLRQRIMCHLKAKVAPWGGVNPSNSIYAADNPAMYAELLPCQKIRAQRKFWS